MSGRCRFHGWQEQANAEVGEGVQRFDASWLVVGGWGWLDVGEVESLAVVTRVLVVVFPQVRADVA